LRRLAPLLCLVLVLGVFASAADARRVVVRRRPARTVVVVRQGWPLRRPARAVVVHPVRTAVAVEAATYLAPVTFVGTAVAASAAPSRDAVVWQDGEGLTRDEDWTQFTLACNATGTRLWLEVPSGKVQLDWAEVVFGNGEARVVDFGERTCVPGLYSLLDFADGRLVDHVRVVARARTPEAQVNLRMQK